MKKHAFCVSTGCCHIVCVGVEEELHGGSRLCWRCLRSLGLGGFLWVWGKLEDAAKFSVLGTIELGFCGLGVGLMV